MVEGGSVMNRYEREVVRIALVAGDDGVIRDTVFVGCDVKGPAVLIARGGILEHNTFRGTAEGLFWEIPPDRAVVIGAILCERCTFSGCTFENVGFAGTAADLDPLRNP